MAKSNKPLIEAAVKKLQELICWWEYYRDNNNPVEAAKAQKQIEDQKRQIKFLREAAGLSA